MAPTSPTPPNGMASTSPTSPNALLDTHQWKRENAYLMQRIKNLEDTRDTDKKAASNIDIAAIAKQAQVLNREQLKNDSYLERLRGASAAPLQGMISELGRRLDGLEQVESNQEKIIQNQQQLFKEMETLIKKNGDMADETKGNPHANQIAESIKEQLDYIDSQVRADSASGSATREAGQAIKESTRELRNRTDGLAAEVQELGRHDN